jgi:3',5'-cyclic AMP phosphodiesterase CpdA
MLIAQITDCHIVEPGDLMADRIDPSVGLRQAISALNSLDPQPDLVLATGDLVNDGTPAQYDHLMSMLSEVTAPLLAIPGNHDDRTEMRSRFRQLPPGGPSDPVDFVVDEYPLRLICIDTNIPGRHDGRVTADQMDWLDRQLSARPDTPTLIVQHHPPFPSGLPWMDRDAGFTGAELEAAVLDRYANIEAVVCGHLHRTIHRRFAGTVASSWPSTAVQLGLGFNEGPTTYTDEPAAFALHHFSGGALNSHAVPVAAADRWVPSWAAPEADGTVL